MRNKIRLTESELINFINRLINEQGIGNEVVSAVKDIEDQYDKDYEFFTEIDNKINTNGWSKIQMKPSDYSYYKFKSDTRESEDKQFPALHAYREVMVDVGYSKPKAMQDQIYVGWDDSTRRLKVLIFNARSGINGVDEIYGPKKNSDSDKKLVLDFIETLRKRGVQLTAQNESYRRSRNTLTESDMRRLTRRILK